MIGPAAAALARTRDATGVVLVGGTLTLLGWVSALLWVGSLLFISPLLLVATPVAFVPSLVARGYFVCVTRRAVETGTPGAPSLVAWGDLLRDGLKSALLSAVLLAPLSVGLLGVAAVGAAVTVSPLDLSTVGAVLDAALGPNGTAAVAVTAGGLLAALVAAYLLAFAYVRPAALAAFAASGRLRDGLRPEPVAATIRSESYAAAWTTAAAALAVGYAVAVPTAPLLVGAALAFVIRTLAHGLYGRGAAETLRSAETSGDGVLTDAEGAGRVDAGGFEFGVVEVVEIPSAPASDRNPTPVAAGDGGRPWRTEASVSVQVGRSVPVGPSAAAVEPRGTGESIDCGDPSDGGGFDWGPALADSEDKS